MIDQSQDRRGQVLRFLKTYFESNGFSPTYEEIMAAVGLSSKSHVDYYLQRLETAGQIVRKRRSPRSLRLAEPSAPFSVKVEGLVACGSPLELAQGLAREIALTTDIADPRKDLFALEVQGDSMMDALVGEGDILIIERKQEVHPRELALVHLRDSNEATVKYLRRQGAKVRLEPAHPFTPAMELDAARVQVQGRVVAVVRRL